MSDNDLAKLARLCLVIDHLEQHGRPTGELEKERDALLAPKPQPQQQVNRGGRR